MTRRNQKLIDQANQLSSSDLHDILLRQANFHLPSSCQLLLSHATDLSNEHRHQILQLFEMNMKTFYEQSDDGYHPEEKQTELFADQSRYVLLFSDEHLIAFAHFRFDVDHGDRVLYLYELQINSNYQGHGLGKWIIEQLTILCRQTQMSKIVLTVHKVNERAIDFYVSKCSFQCDSTDPSDDDVYYRILSLTV